MPPEAPVHEVHLVVDSTLSRAADPGPGRRGDADRVLRTVRVRAAVSHLRPGARDEELVGATASADSLVIEPLADGADPRLLLLAPRGAPGPTVNGRRAPRVCLLRVGDQLLLDDGRVLHVTVFHRPRIRPAAEDQVGSLCGVCRTPISREARVFTCPCGSVMHFDGSGEASGGDPLYCATLRAECASCGRPVRLEAGISYVPAFD